MMLVHKFVKEKDAMIKRILITALFFVTGMASLMSFFGALMSTGFSTDLFSTWLNNIALNFPMAYFLQVAIVGPLVRFIFGKVCPGKVVSK